jgi:hypothetical protein
MEEIAGLWICILMLLINQIGLTYEIVSFIYRYTPPIREEDIELNEIYVQLL